MQLNENRVRERAYKIWESEGRPEGLADRHWNMACEYEDSAQDDQADSYSTLGQDSDQDSTFDQDEKKNSPHHKPTHKKGNDHHH
jgi:hypothetical protein